MSLSDQFNGERGQRLSTWGLRLFAVLAALIAWTLVTLDQIEPVHERVLNVGVVYDTPQGYVLLRRPDQVQIAVRGPESAVRSLNPFQVSIVVQPEAQLGPQEVPLQPSQVQLPLNLSVTSIDPEALSLELDQVETRPILVKPRLAGEPAAGAVVVSATSDPASVTVRGSRRLLASMDSVTTTPISLDGHALDFSETAVVVSGQPTGIQIVGPQLVQVEIDLEVPVGAGGVQGAEDE